MVDLSAVAPSEMARLQGKPEGDMGHAVGEMLNPTLGAEIFDYYGTMAAEAASFTEAMTGLTAPVASEVARLLDTKGLKRVVDIGGAAGALLFSVLNTNPHLEGVVFDLPNVVPDAQVAAQAAGFSRRVEIIAGNFFENVPEGDLYLLKYILHDRDDADCVRILSNCRRALRPGGRVAIVELLLGDVGQAPIAPLMDLNMMVMLAGLERTLDEYRALLGTAGFGECYADQYADGDPHRVRDPKAAAHCAYRRPSPCWHCPRSPS